jgi:phosphoribosylformimino-5-aminoimidazole carboxamide ribotide isomerase
LARRFASAGVTSLVVTEISRDGTLAGPDGDGLSRLLAETAIPVVASGGVGTLAHLRTLASIEVPVQVDADSAMVEAGQGAAARRLAGAIVGRALYEGQFSVAEALAAVEEVRR